MVANARTNAAADARVRFTVIEISSFFLRKWREEGITRAVDGA
jgi:hypothetical protein